MADKNKRFSLSRALINSESRNAPEFEEIFALEKAEEAPMRDAGLFAAVKKPGASFKLPFERMVLTRDLEATTGSAANLLGGTYIPAIQAALRPTALVAKLPITWLEGLRANLSLPRLSTGVAALPGTEIQSLVSSDPVFGVASTAGSPSRATASGTFSKQLLAQAAGNVSLDTFLTTELMKSLSYQVDVFTLNGSGSAGQPVGLLTLGASLTQNTWGAAVSWPNILAAQKTMETYFDAQDLTWLIGPATAAKLRAAPRGSTNVSFHILEADSIGNIACAVSPFVGSGETTCLANWADLVLGFFGNGFDVTYDQFSKARTGEIVITITVFYCVQPRRIESFLISTDSGAQ
jgi:hypothetical protein